MRVWASRLLLFSVSLTVLGCKTVDVGAVRDYVKTVNAASSSFDDVAADFAAACLRVRELSLTRAEELRTVPEPAAPPVAGPVATDTLGAADCTGAQGVSAEWTKRNTIIVGYVRALGAIVDVDTQPSGFSQLATNLQSVGVMTAAQTAPFADLATTIGNLLLQGKQEALLYDFTRRANPSLSGGTEALVAVVQGPYLTILQNERTTADNFFRDELRSKTKGTFDRLEVYRIRSDWADRRAAIARRMRAANAYADALQTIAKTNADIVAASDQHKSFGEMVGVIGDKVQPILDDVAKLRSST